MAVSKKVLDGDRGTAGRLLKVDHAGEHGAVNIYRAQILVSKILRPSLVPKLKHFKEHEERHLSIFGAELERRDIRRCRSFWFCGVGGWVLGFLTALLGKAGVMACTAAVETVVTEHLFHQLEFMQQRGGAAGYDAVNDIIEEELEHQRTGILEGQDSWLFKPLSFVASRSTEFVIWMGLRLP